MNLPRGINRYTATLEYTHQKNDSLRVRLRSDFDFFLLSDIRYSFHSRVDMDTKGLIYILLSDDDYTVKGYTYDNKIYKSLILGFNPGFNMATYTRDSFWATTAGFNQKVKTGDLYTEIMLLYTYTLYDRGRSWEALVQLDQGYQITNRWALESGVIFNPVVATGIINRDFTPLISVQGVLSYSFNRYFRLNLKPILTPLSLAREQYLFHVELEFYW